MALTREKMDKMIDEHFGYEASDNVEGVLPAGRSAWKARGARSGSGCFT